MKWPWQRLERRESSYTDALVQAIIAQNSGSRTVATATATAAMESAAGIIGRSFAAADVGGPAPVTAALTPARLNMVGRTLIRKGEFAAYLDVVDGLLTITPASDWDVTGGYDPADWTYRLNLAGPSRSITRSNVRGESVLHVMYSADPETPWRGVGPHRSGADSWPIVGGNRAGSRRRSEPAERQPVLGVPGKDGADSGPESLRGQIRGLKGQVGPIESRQTWANDDGTNTRREWAPDRSVSMRPPLR